METLKNILAIIGIIAILVGVYSLFNNNGLGLASNNPIIIANNQKIDSLQKDINHLNIEKEKLAKKISISDSVVALYHKQLDSLNNISDKQADNIEDLESELGKINHTNYTYKQLIEKLQKYKSPL